MYVCYVRYKLYTYLYLYLSIVLRHDIVRLINDLHRTIVNLFKYITVHYITT